MYEVRLSPDEMMILKGVTAKFRDHYDDYPGSQMALTNKTNYTLAANLFLAAAEKPILPTSHQAQVPLSAMRRTDIEISKEPDGQFLIRSGGAFGVLARTAVPYEIDLVSDASTKTLLTNINIKFANQPDVLRAALELQAS